MLHQPDPIKPTNKTISKDKNLERNPINKNSMIR